MAIDKLTSRWLQAGAAMLAFAGASPIFIPPPAPYFASREPRRYAPPAKRVRLVAKRSEFDAVVNRLTNWQRNQWARTGYPGLRERNAERVRPFTTLERRNAFVMVAA